MSKFRLVCLIVAASFSGVVCSDLLCRSTAFRDAAGLLAGHGRLVAITNGKGIYEKDLQDRDLYTASDLIVSGNLSREARNETPDKAKVEEELATLRAQFGDDQSFRREVRANVFSVSELRERVADQIRSRQWLDRRIAGEAVIAEKEARDFYETHPTLFMQPVRYRASHIFLAAHADTPPETVEAKREMIDELAGRLARGETWPQLAAEASEDEATKSRGGDLGFFSRERVAPEFFAEVEKLAVGERSNPFQSHLGFHIVKVTEIRPARVVSFDEARAEILLALTNQKRALLTERLAVILGAPVSNRLN